jgi:HNH endonuclease
MSQYGLKCAVCDIRHPQLLKAAHICGKSQKGSDDWRNGIPLCSTHHDAFDHHFFCIEPASGSIMYKPGIKPKGYWPARIEAFSSQKLPSRRRFTMAMERNPKGVERAINGSVGLAPIFLPSFKADYAVNWLHPLPYRFSRPFCAFFPTSKPLFHGGAGRNHSLTLTC